MIDYIDTIINAEKLCEEFQNRVLIVYFNRGKSNIPTVNNFAATRYYAKDFEPIAACIELCRILKPHSLVQKETEFYEAASNLLQHKIMTDYNAFNVNLGMIRLGLKMVRDEISIFHSSFEEDERQRINEAIHTYLEKCYYSCVAMAVSAAESRLLKLMLLVNPNSAKELEKKTLGELMKEYSSDKAKYKNIVPRKHEPLIDLCNTYRIFSVHPKKQQISANIATSILHLSLTFLTDIDTIPETVKTKLEVSP